MQIDARQSVARSLDAPVELIPFLPELLADLNELGTGMDDALALLAQHNIAPGRAIDLGCGKGALCLALAQRGWHVQGIDGMADFIAHAQREASRLNVSDRCAFTTGDLRDINQFGSNFDLACLMSIGPIFGSHALTVRAMRSLVRPGGHIIIADGFLREGHTRSRDYPDHMPLKETRTQLMSRGDQIIDEIISDGEADHEWDERVIEMVRTRAAAIAERHPELRDLLDAYVQEQQRQTDLLSEEMIGAVWLIERSADNPR